MTLRESIQIALDKALALNPKMTAYQIAKQYGTSYPNLKDALDGGRGFSQEMLVALGKCPDFPMSYIDLLTAKLKEDHPEDLEKVVKNYLSGLSKSQIFALLDNVSEAELEVALQKRFGPGKLVKKDLG